MCIQKLIFLVSLILSITVQQSFGLYPGPSSYGPPADEAIKSKTFKLFVSKRNTTDINKLQTREEKIEAIEDSPIIYEIPDAASFFSDTFRAAGSFLEGGTEFNLLYAIMNLLNINVDLANDKALKEIRKQIGNDGIHKILENTGTKMTFILDEYLKETDKEYKESKEFREKLKTEIEKFFKIRQLKEKKILPCKKKEESIQQFEKRLEEAIENQKITPENESKISYEIELGNTLSNEERRKVQTNYIKNNIDKLRSKHLEKIVPKLEAQILNETDNNIEKVINQCLIEQYIECKEIKQACVKSLAKLLADNLDNSNYYKKLYDQDLLAQLVPYMTYSLSSVDEMIKIFHFLQNQTKEEPETSAINAKISILKYFKDPQITLNNIFNLNINLPLDLPKGADRLFKDYDVEINWQDTYNDLNAKWSTLIKQKVISSADIRNQLYERLLITAKAFLNKKGRRQEDISMIPNNSLFKSALNLFSCDENKFNDIRFRLNRPNKINLVDMSITDQDLPFIVLFLNKISNVSAVKELYLNENNLTELKDEIFTGLTKLKKLSIPRNKLTRLKDGAFTGLIELEEIDLLNNKIQSISNKAFSGLEKLKELRINSNKIQNLPNGVFNGLTALKILGLRHNNIQSLPNGVFNGLTELKILGLSGNKIQNLPNEIFNDLTALEILYLQDNNIQSLPNGVFNGLTELKILSLNGNNIQSLPNEVFNGLTALKMLYLQDNNIQSLPNEIFNDLTALEKLDLSINKIQSLPNEIFNDLTALKILDLNNNDLECLPENLNEILPNIEKICIENAGKNNQPIKIPIKEADRKSFEKKLYKKVFDERAKKGSDYFFVDPEQKNDL